VEFTTHHYPASQLKKEYSCTSLPLGIDDLIQGEFAHLNIILLFIPISSVWSLPFSFPTKTLSKSILPIRATCPAHLILFDRPNNNCILDEAEVDPIRAKKA
jgi:hypothetical protein